MPRKSQELSALALLKGLPNGEPQDQVFHGTRGPLSAMSLTAVLRRLKVAATAHGFRSTFRAWARYLGSGRCFVAVSSQYGAPG